MGETLNGGNIRWRKHLMGGNIRWGNTRWGKH